jgi:hypothetical protein
VLTAVSVRHPFVTADEAAFFLQVSVTTARRWFDYGQLPAALRLDGGPFQPTKRSRLIPYDKLLVVVDDDARGMLDLWQQGRFELPKPTGVNALPVDFEAVLLSLTASDNSSDETVEA